MTGHIPLLLFQMVQLTQQTWITFGIFFFCSYGTTNTADKTQNTSLAIFRCYYYFEYLAYAIKFLFHNFGASKAKYISLSSIWSSPYGSFGAAKVVVMMLMLVLMVKTMITMMIVMTKMTWSSLLKEVQAVSGECRYAQQGSFQGAAKNWPFLLLASFCYLKKQELNYFLEIF